MISILYGSERTCYEPAGQNYSRFSHHVTETSPDIGVETAKQALYDETRQNLNAFLEARPDDTPFCYWWGPTNTYRTWERGSGKALWDLEPDDLEGRLLTFLPDVHDVREDVCDYLGECMAVDAGLGVLLEKLEEIGDLDNILIIVSGDHGILGFPRAKCNLYNIGCEVALAARWPGHIEPGRSVDDFVNLMDLGPTFLDAADVAIPESMTAQSLLPVLESAQSGQVESQRDTVILGRERHVGVAREGNLPYPQRAIRTHDFLYVHNFEPDRWPMGDPMGLDDLAADAPDFHELQWDTRVAYADSTKAWMIHRRAEEAVQPLFELGFGKRPQVELYDLRTDPDYMINVAADPAYAEIREQLQDRLMEVLRAQNDPRIVEVPCRFEHPPFAGPALWKELLT